MKPTPKTASEQDDCSKVGRVSSAGKVSSSLVKAGMLFAVLTLIATSCGRSTSDSADNTAAPTTAAATATTAAPGATTQPSGGSGSGVANSDGSDDGTDDNTGGGSTNETPAAPTTTTPPDPCANAQLEASEIGITEDTITVLVMADVNSPLAPGLFQGSLDGVNAWARHVNANGGLACRQIEVIEHDSKINAEATTNGFLRACEDALAMVGSTSLFVTNLNDLNTCPDQAGNPTGIPDIPERAAEPAHGCAANTFSINNAECPVTENNIRQFHISAGPYRWLLEQNEAAGGDPLHGIYLIPADLPSTIHATITTARGQGEIGFVNDGEFGVVGSATQASYAQYVTVMKSSDSNYASNSSNDQAMLKLKRESQAQGIDLDSITWVCTLTCYTRDFVEQDVANGTYVWLSFVPFEERGINPELDAFLTAIDDDSPPSWAAGAWASARLFEDTVNEIVARDGLNGITRQGILDVMNEQTLYDSNGMFAPYDVGNRLPSKCFMMTQVVDNEFVRVYPEEPGTFDCGDDNTFQIRFNPAREFSEGPEGFEERKAEYDAQFQQ